MKKPCSHDPAIPDSCRLCYLFLHDKRYNLLWGGDGNVTAPPNILQKAANFGRAVATHAMNRFQRAEPAEVERRLAVCAACNYLKDGRCTHAGCGCPVAKKASWQSQYCPIGKWKLPVIEVKNE